MKTWWEISSCEETQRVIANSWKDAVRVAWKDNPPQELGTLIRVRRLNGGSRQEPWQFVDAREAVRAAGYKILRRNK